jgi:hypothetical protein
MEFPADLSEEGSLVGIDLFYRQAGHLAPGLGGVVAILQIFRSQNEGCKEHSTSAHERAVRRAFPRLFHCEVALRHEGLDQDQVVQRDLKGRIARARASERLFNVGAERQDAASGGSLSRAARDHG